MKGKKGERKKGSPNTIQNGVRFKYLSREN
jgi:hypothetical protein